jgi:hypothetical protein
VACTFNYYFDILIRLVFEEIVFGWKNGTVKVGSLGRFSIFLLNSAQAVYFGGKFSAVIILCRALQ